MDGAPKTEDPLDALPAHCVTCAEAWACLLEGRGPEDYPSCRRPLRGAPAPRLRDLTDLWLRTNPIDDPRARRLLGDVLARSQIDQRTYSELFEASFQARDDRVDLLRFSYGFPAFRRSPADATETILGWVRPFGAAPHAFFAALLRRARHPCVEQVLAGIAWNDGDGLRLKLYLQFSDSAGDDALGFAGSILGARGFRRANAGRLLHLLCFAHGWDGVVGVNAYFKVPPFDPAAPPRGLQENELLSDLAARGVRSIRRGVDIHRMRGSDDDAVDQSSAFSLPPPENELRWSFLRGLPSIGRQMARAPAAAELLERFHVAMRWITVNHGPARSVTGYYVLNERRAPAG